jgi:outer membrane receptor for ferrienterochelin and colicin
MMSQETASLRYESIPLNDVISDMESTFNIRLSYDPELTSNLVVTYQNAEATLRDVIIAIESQTNVEFSRVSYRYYIVRRQKEFDLSNTQQLDEVIIMEYLTSGINQRTDNSILVSPDKLGILPGLTEPDVLLSLQMIPGVQSPSETASGLFIRGGTPDQNLILWDGIKMYHSGHFFGTISAFNPYITKEIKLIKSGASARYGNRISSVVDITSENKVPEETQGGFGFNMTHGDLYLKVPLSDKTGIVVSSRRSFTDIYETPTFRNQADRIFQNTKISQGNKIFEDDIVTTTKDLFIFSDLTLKAIIQPSDNDEIVISNLITNNKLDYRFLIEEFDEAASDNLDVSNLGSSLSWHHNIDQEVSHKFQAYYSNFNLEYVGTNSIVDEFNDRLDKNNRVDDIGFSYNADWSIDSSNSINFGYQFSSNNVKYTLGFQDSESPEDEFEERDEDTNNTHALYVDYELRKKDRWYINLGVRTNYMSIMDKVLIEPRVQFGHHLSSDFRIKFSLERLHQTISQIVEFDSRVNTQEFGLENQIWVLSNEESIPILKSSQFTTGLIFDNNGWSLDIDAYYKHISGLTSFTAGFDREDIDNSVFSKGKSKVFGLDVLLKKKINNYRTWIGYSYVDNKFEFDSINDGDDFSGNFDITHQLIWSQSLEWKDFNLSLGWSLRTGTPFTKAEGIIEDGFDTFIDFGEFNGERLPAYHKLDISATYKFDISNDKKWKGKIGLAILNIYDRENVLRREYHIRRDPVDGSNVLRQIDNSSLGITPNLVFRVDF